MHFPSRPRTLASLLPLLPVVPLLVAFAATAAAGCNAKTATVLASDPDASEGADASPTADASPSSDASTSDAAPHEGPSCVTDQDCNEDKTVSALWGSCFHGLCMCNEGFTVQPKGLCNVAKSPACATSLGTCRSLTLACNAGELSGDDNATTSCGDLVESACCYPENLCAGPAGLGGGVDFVCCAPNDAVSQPRCVNGWQTCPGGHTPVLKSVGGCG